MYAQVQARLTNIVLKENQVRRGEQGRGAKSGAQVPKNLRLWAGDRVERDR